MSHVHATQDDPVVASLSEVVGGPVGGHAGRPRWGTPLAVLLALTAVVFALGLITKASCADTDWDDGNGQFSHLCYSDVPYAYTGTGLVQLSWPWTGDPVQRARYGTTTQPALVGLWSYAAARVTHVLVGSPDLGPRYATDSTTLAAQSDVLHERTVFVAVNAVGLGLVALLGTWALSCARRRRPWDAAAFAVAPVLALAGIVSWDLLGAVAAAGAVWAWSRGRPVAAGVLVGLGAAAGVWPALLLVAMGVTSWRRDRVEALLRDVLPATVTAVAVWALVNAPAFLSGRSQWEVFWRTAATRHADAGSFWAVLDQAVGIGAGTVTACSWFLVVAWCVGVVVLATSAPVAPRLTQVGFLLVAGVTLLGASYRPQQVLWLLPLAALARPRWRDQLVWQAGEVVYFAMVWWWLGGLLAPSEGGGHSGFYWVAIGIRIACLGWLVAVVVRDVWWPEHDPLGEDRLGGLDRLDGGSGYETSTRSNDVVV